MLRNDRPSHLSHVLNFRLSILLNVFAGVLLLGIASPPLWAQVTTTQSAVNFGAVAVGAATGDTQSLSFTIPSGVTLGGISAVTQGTANLDFTVAKGGSCASGVTGASCTVQVQFRPTAPGPQMGAVVLSDRSTPPNTLIAVPLSGIGTGPMVAFGPGIISTLAGNGLGGYGGDGGPATGAQLYVPEGVALDGAGNLYIADLENDLIRKVGPDGTITRVAGTYVSPLNNVPVCGYSGDGGPATSAQLCAPSAVTLDGAGNLYIADQGNSVVRKVTLGGTITTVAGVHICPTSPFCPPGDGGPATSAGLYCPDGLAVDTAGNLYIAQGGSPLDGFGVIRKVTPDGIITTVAGTQSVGYSGDNGTATGAQLNLPTGLAFDGAGNLYIADRENEVIRKVTPQGTISTVAGKFQCCNDFGGGVQGYSGDGGPATIAQLDLPTGLTFDGAGNLYIADYDNHVIRKVTPDGTITTVVGNGVCGYPTESCYSGDGGPATSAQLSFTWGVAADAAGNLYIDDLGNNVIRKVDVSAAPSLSFADTDVGGASAAQDVSVLNLGNAPLTISRVSTAANFTLDGSDTSCSSTGQTLSAAGSCVLGTEFNPTDAGSISGSVALTDNTLNASSATQSVALRGSATTPGAAVKYTLAASSPSMTMNAGGSTAATLNLTSTNYVGIISFATSVSSANGTASDVTGSASPVMLTAGGSGSSTITITANGSAAKHAPVVPWRSGAMMLCAVLLGAPFTLRRRTVAILLAAAISLAGLAIACGGGSSSSTKASPSITARTYTVTVTPTGTGAVANPAPVSITVAVQ